MTPAIPTLSEAFAVIVTVPDTEELAVGDVIETVGGVMSAVVPVVIPEAVLENEEFLFLDEARSL